MCAWFVEHLGRDVPLHFSAFHPDWKMRDVPVTPLATLRRARQIALRHGVRYVYTGNVRDPEGASTWCHACGAQLIGRDGYAIGQWSLSPEGRCRECGTTCTGVFGAKAGDWGPHRAPVRLSA
jgi:pyruvate formate lyase activating enzyme